MEKLRKCVIGSKSAKETECSSSWCDLLSGSSRKAMIIGIVLASTNQMCGCFAMLNYTAHIFEEAGSSISPNMSAIVVGIIQLFGSYVANFLVDRAGRKVHSTVTVYEVLTAGNRMQLHLAIIQKILFIVFNRWQSIFFW